jgi:hypothetical protein
MFSEKDFTLLVLGAGIEPTCNHSTATIPRIDITTATGYNLYCFSILVLNGLISIPIEFL